VKIHELDVRGEICPYPELRTKQAAEKLKPGEILQVLIDDPLATETIPRWADKAGYLVNEEKIGNSQWKLTIHLREVL